jgi:pyruvate formate-lyase/glycerol dehydratase family glycyl radical enzyme
MSAEKVISSAGDSPGSRGKRLWERALENRKNAKLSLARALMVMDSYRETEGFPAPIRRARALEKIVAGIPIFIDSDELLVGAFSAKPMYFEWYPEYAVDQEMLSQDIEGLLAENHSLEDIAKVIRYFKDSCLQSSYFSLLDDSQRQKIRETCEDGAWVYRAKTTLDIDRGYHSVDYRKAIEKGFLGVLAEVENELHKTTSCDDDSYRKCIYLKGLAIALKAGIGYAGRYASLTRELAGNSSGSRKSELEAIAEVCDRVPAHPARNFHEAVQTSLFLHVLIHLESRAQESPGRMDQYLFSYYQKDIREGTLTPEAALEILECFRVKLSTLRLLSSIKYNEIVSGEAQYHNVTLGGQTPDGRDATNDLSYLFLKAAERTRTPHPTLSIRWHDKMPKDFAIKGLELVRGGLGFPAFFNDKSNIQWLLSIGVPLEEARSHCISGCLHSIVPGQTSPFDVLFISIAKCLELALHDGFDPRTARQLGPKTGEFAQMNSYDDLFRSFKTQVEHFSKEGGAIISEQKIARSQVMPAMVSSAFTEDCIKKGKGCLADGARYNIIIQAPVGMIDAADSLAAIKRCVFEDGAIGKQELLDALAINFKGKEALRKRLAKAPKYGNDDDFADGIAAELYGWWWKMVSGIDGPYGVKQLPAPYSVSVHGAAGKRVGALPSGRLAEQPLADGSVSPCQGADMNGPTAVINSAGKIDQVPLFGTLLNMKFHPSAMKTDEDLKKIATLIKTYFDYGGKHAQFNVVDSKTLKEAQKEPERHRNLMVRVAGYSAYFTELSSNVQDEIIMRTEFTSGG